MQRHGAGALRAAGVIVRIVAVQHGHRRAMLDEELDNGRADAPGLAPP